MRKRTPEEIEEDLNNAKASVEMEGLTVSEEAIAICRRLAAGEITDKEAEKEILKFHGIKKGGYNHEKKNT